MSSSVSIGTDSPAIEDEPFPVAPRLLSGAGRGIVAAALAEEGATLHGLRSDFVLYTPGSGMTINYVASVSWDAGTATDHVVVAFARNGRRPPAGVYAEELAGTEVGVWRFPNDPYLLGLRNAADPAFVSQLLRRLGLPRGHLELELRAYRPGLRAVIKATLSSPTLLYRASSARLEPATNHRVFYLKVLRPGEVGALAMKHETFADLLPAPQCVHRDDELGILLLSAMPGDTLSACLSRGPEDHPDPEVLLEPLDRLATVSVTGPRLPTVYDAVGSHVHLLRSIVPRESERVARIAEMLTAPSRSDLITAHGDFYDSQVLISAGRVAGLLDLDDVGPGERVDDLATMAGRVWTIARTAPVERRAQLTAYALHMFEVFSDRVDPDELDRRVGGILLGRATGPFRAQQRDWPQQCAQRVRAAEEWLRAPRRPDARV